MDGPPHTCMQQRYVDSLGLHIQTLIEIRGGTQTIEKGGKDPGGVGEGRDGCELIKIKSSCMKEKIEKFKISHQIFFFFFPRGRCFETISHTIA